MSRGTVIVSDDTFEDEVLRAKMPIIVDFWAAWSLSCQFIAPVLEEIAEEQAGKLIVAKLNVDQNPATTFTYRVHSIPRQDVFSGGRLVKSILDARSKSAIMAQISDFI
jgi:thioredoxin 1